MFELRFATPFVVSGPIDLLALLFAIRMSWLQSCLSGLSGLELELERERSLAVSTARIQVQLSCLLDSSRTSNALHNFSAKVHKFIRNSRTEFLNVLKVSLRLFYESSLWGGSTWFSGVVCQPHAHRVHPVSTRCLRGGFFVYFLVAKYFLTGFLFY